MTLHYLTGLPRSGSTLLGNLLAQNDDVYVSGTSPVAAAVAQVREVLSSSTEATATLIKDPVGYQRIDRTLRSIPEAWYHDREESVIIDKSRPWIAHTQMIRQWDSNSRVIVCVRDPRDVMASIERQHDKTPAISHQMGDTLAARMADVCSDEGLIGGPVRYIADHLHRRDLTNIVFVQYEGLVSNPVDCLKVLNEQLDLPEFDYDLEDVVNVATDVDPLYRMKFPHQGQGKITDDGEHWSERLDGDIANSLIERWPLFCSTFGYEAADA